MEQQQQKLADKSNHWAIQLRQELFFSGSHFYNEFIREITADFEGLTPRMVTPKELDAVRGTLQRLGNHIAQLEGQRGNHINRVHTNGDGNLKSCVAPHPFGEFRTELNLQLAKDQNQKNTELDQFRDAGDLILHRATLYASPDTKKKITELLIEVFKEMKRD